MEAVTSLLGIPLLKPNVLMLGKLLHRKFAHLTRLNINPVIPTTLLNH